MYAGMWNGRLAVKMYCTERVYTIQGCYSPTFSFPNKDS